MRIATADIEAYNWTEFMTAGLYDGTDYQYFTDVDDFIDVLCSPKFLKRKIYFHYGGNFDFKFLLEGLCRRCKYIKIIDAGSRILQIAYSVNGKNYTYLIDSFNLLPMAQKKLAEGFGVEHQKTEIDFSRLKRKDYYSESMSQRLRNDTIGLYEIIAKFASWGLHKNKLKMTLASQSLDVFKTNFQKCRLTCLNKENESFIRSCYFGGRVEIFKRYGRGLFYYDVNSLYPYVMLGEMPTGQARKVKTYHPDRIGFYRIRLNMNCEIPFIPVVVDKKLLFPNGTFEAFVSSADIEELIGQKQTFQVCEGITFTGREKIYVDYIRGLYEIKRKSRPGEIDYIISKLEMNSLYGKHGQRREREEVIFCEDFNRIRKEHLIPYYEELGFYKKLVESKSKDIHPYLSAWVTSKARLELYRWLKLVGLESIWYCDTDSLITDKELPVGDELGSLKLEHKISEAVFLQPKVYSIIDDHGENFVKIKGFRNHKVSHTDFLRVLENDDLSSLNVSGTKILGYKENLFRHHSLKITKEKIFKSLKTPYNKRAINSDGISTKALILKEGQLWNG
jgi:hypothetical protein